MIIIENDHLAPSLDDSTSIYILEIFRLVVQTRVNRTYLLFVVVVVFRDMCFIL